MQFILFQSPSVKCCTSSVQFRMRCIWDVYNEMYLQHRYTLCQSLYTICCTAGVWKGDLMLNERTRVGKEIWIVSKSPAYIKNNNLLPAFLFFSNWFSLLFADLSILVSLYQLLERKICLQWIISLCYVFKFESCMGPFAFLFLGGWVVVVEGEEGRGSRHTLHISKVQRAIKISV